MRKVILSTLITLDGFINHDVMLADDELHEYSVEATKQAGALIFGRVTYQLFAPYWPLVLADPSSPPPELEYARVIEAAPKIVFSKTLENAEWNNTSLMREVDPAVITAMKQEPGGDLVISSGVRLARSFLKLGLVDEFSLLVNPIILGEGLSLFEGLRIRMDLELLRTRTFGSGVVLLEYRVVHTERGDHE